MIFFYCLICLENDKYSRNCTKTNFFFNIIFYQLRNPYIMMKFLQFSKYFSKYVLLSCSYFFPFVFLPIFYKIFTLKVSIGCTTESDNKPEILPPNKCTYSSLIDKLLVDFLSTVQKIEFYIFLYYKNFYSDHNI
jgi:hypothetical protein